MVKKMSTQAIAAAVLAFMLTTPAIAQQSSTQLPAQQPLSLQQQLDLAKASVDRTFDSMTTLILQQEAQNAKLVGDVAALKKATEPAPAAAPKPGPHGPILHDLPMKGKGQ